MENPKRKPTWIRDIAPVLHRHAREEKWSGPARELASYGTVIKRKPELVKFLAEGFEGAKAAGVLPLHFSEEEYKLFKAWISSPNPLVVEITDKESLLNALQSAVKLELETLPPYLTAMYSIKEQSESVRSTLKSIAMDEMHHFGFACNLLVSVGGTPDLISEDAVPEYPTQLAYGLGDNLQVHLRKFGRDQIEAFMEIEKPTITRDVGVDTDGFHYVDENSREDPRDDTIGKMYEDIKNGLIDLYDKGEISFEHQDEQVRHLPYITKIKSLEDAKNAIDKIVGEGQGVDEEGLDPNGPDGELAHYYKFSEIKYGRKITRYDNGKGFRWDGEIVNAEVDVHDMMDDPNIKNLENPSDAYTAAEKFIDKYVEMLNCLNLSWSGEPSKIKDAITVMSELADEATICMETPSGNDGKMVGTPFQISK